MAANNTLLYCDGNGNGKRMKLMEETKEDRLSSLPDEILINILSRLPTYCAFQTAFFSRRWRNLWKGVTTVDSSTSVTRFKKDFKVITHLTSPNIPIFKLSFIGDFFTTSDWKLVKDFYLLLLSRNVKVLKLRSTSDSFPAYLPVPNCVFSCESLVELELDGENYWNEGNVDYLESDDDDDDDLLVNNGTASSLFNLPNLKKLCLRVSILEYNLLKTLLKYCPLLEDLCLVLDLIEFDRDFCIASPYLKSLSIEVEEPASGSNIVIAAPNLVKLKIRDPCSFYKFRRVPTSLVEASINLKHLKTGEWFPLDDDDWTFDGHALALSEFVRGMSSVRRLTVKCDGDMLPFMGPQVDYGDIAVFPDLIFFKATIETLYDWEDLLRCLHCFPNLEHLELKMDDDFIVPPYFWVAPIVLADCLSTKLKRITVRRSIGVSEEMKLFEFILNHAYVLEELRVYGPSDSLMENKMTQSELLWTEYMFCQALVNLPRSSLTCRILFSGVYIKNASSNNVCEKQSIDCQIMFKNSSDSEKE